jgi:hypothetical protein
MTHPPSNVARQSAAIGMKRRKLRAIEVAPVAVNLVATNDVDLWRIHGAIGADLSSNVSKR